MRHLLFLAALLASAQAAAIEVRPIHPQVYDLITITYEAGSYIEIQSIRDGKLFFPKIREIGSPSSELIFTGPPGEYWVFGREGDQRIRQRVVIEGADPDPEPEPSPGPEPGPKPDPDPQPDDLAGIAKTLYELALKEVPEKDRKEQAGPIADVYAGTSSAIAAGAINSILEVQEYAKRAWSESEVKAHFGWRKVVDEFNRVKREEVDTLDEMAEYYALAAAGIRESGK